jgi:hypothetical protein
MKGCGRGFVGVVQAASHSETGLSERLEMETGAMIAYCGLPCHSCPLHLLTLETDADIREQKKADIIRLCRESYNMEFQPGDNIACDGCRTEGGKLFAGCGGCGVRNCARERKVENCAVCGEYVCEALKDFFRKDPEAEARLEAIRNAV